MNFKVKTRFLVSNNSWPNKGIKKNKVEVLTVRLFSIHLPLKLKQQI